MLRRIFSSALVTALLLLSVCACLLGAVSFGKVTRLSEAGQERMRAETRQWERQQEAERPARLFWSWAQRVMGALAIVGGASVAWLYGLRRAVTIAPDRRGIFPILLGWVSGTWVVYDPNRSPTAATTLGAGRPAIQVTHALPAGLEAAQAQITSQAQSVQLAAAMCGADREAITPALLSSLSGARHALTRPLPEVRRSPWESSHVERLLIEAGELEDEETLR